MEAGRATSQSAPGHQPLAREYAGFKGRLRKNDTPHGSNRLTFVLSLSRRRRIPTPFSISGEVSSSPLSPLLLVPPILPALAPDPTPLRACSRLKESSPPDFIDRSDLARPRCRRPGFARRIRAAGGSQGM
jgi:hypothetical protein